MLLCPWNFQTRTLERVAISSYRESCWPRDWIHISCTGRWTFYHQATWEAQIQLTKHHKILKLNLKHFLYLNNYKIRYGNNTEEHKGLTTIIFLRYFIVIQSLSHVQLFVTPWNAACQDSLSFTISWSLLKLMSIEWVMPSYHLILCHLLLLSLLFFSSDFKKLLILYKTLVCFI